MSIWTINNKKQEKFLRRKADDFDFKKHGKKEIRELAAKMRREMNKAGGIGLSANQLGLNMKVFVAKIDNKFYALFNPKITKESAEKNLMEEGCLSVPGKFGYVERADKVVLEAFNINGKKVKIKAWGLLARVFQHEADHLNGVLFIDKTKKIYKLSENNAQKI